MSASKEEQVFAALHDAETEAPIGSHGMGDGTVYRIMRDAGLGEATIRRGLHKLQAQGRAHIHGWTNVSPRAPIWIRGPGKDAPRPPMQTPAEAQRLCKERKRLRQANTPAALQERDGSIREQTLACIERARQNPQTWFGALPGAQSVEQIKELA